jgi:hypothetical protein
MRLALIMAKMAKGGFWRVAIVETRQLFKKPCVVVLEEKKQGVECPVHKMVKSAMERHPAMVDKNHTAGCLPCQFGTPKNPQTRWRCRGTTAPPPEPVGRMPTWPSLPGTPPVPPGNPKGHQSYSIVGMPSRCVYMHSPLPNNQYFNHNKFAKDSKRDKDLNPNL